MAIIAAPVAAWIGGALASAGATAAVATTVGAIAGAVAVGVVSGAVIGAATALVTGGDILDGALTGALIGGLTAGVVSGLGAAMSAGTSTATSVGTNASTTAALQGPNAALFSTTASPATVAASNAANATVGGVVSTATPGYSSGSLAAPNIPASQVAAAPSSPVTSPPAADRGFIDKMLFDSEGTLNPETGKIIAGIGSGAAKALLTPEPESNLEYLKQQQKLMNTSADFSVRTANIKIPDSWKKYNKLASANLKQAPSKGGVAYASPA